MLSDLDPDAKLVERIAHGDPAGIRMFVAAKLPRILGLASRMLQDSGEAEDVAQEAFVRVWKQASVWQPGRARFDTWLHTVVLNLCRDRLRRRQEITADTLPEAIDPAPDAEATLLRKEYSEAIAAAIASLPERQREAILLVHYQDMSGTQAALALDVSVDALESLLARGRRTLRAQFAAARGHDA